MPTCTHGPADKRAFGTDVGQALRNRYGARKFYQPGEVSSVLTRYPIDWHCWAYCLFLSLDDFDALHAARGEVCDYAAMQDEMLGALAGAGGLAVSALEGASGGSWWDELKEWFSSLWEHLPGSR
jgi:hypothetical protein